MKLSMDPIVVSLFNSGMQINEIASLYNVSPEEVTSQIREARQLCEVEKKLDRIRELRSCNRHSDCDYADSIARSRGATFGASHCHDECCEDCFGS